ncbi:MAG TPA: lipopolysaccharide biosynthesis protein [Anaeromyxobacter sp.]
MERTYTLHDALAVLRRRRAIALAVGGVALAIGLIAALAVPSEWSATSVVQIEPRRLPADFFPAQGGGSFDERLRTVKHGVLARPVLERVVREVSWASDLGGNLEERISRLRRAVEVRLEGEMAGGAPGLLFVVEVRGPDREKVARAAKLLPEVYAELTREVLTAQARSLRETMEAQAAALGKLLSEHEARLLAFKVQHAPELPEMVETNARSMARLQGLMDMRLGAIGDARRRRADLLASIPEGPSAPGMAEAGLDAALRRLQSLEAAYGENHPDVVRARRELEEARARRDEEWKRFRRERIDAQLARIDADVRDDRSALASLEQERQALQKRLDAAPRWGQELAGLSRDYETLRGRYTGAVSRRADAEAAEALLAADRPTLFREVDPASLPARPSAPDRPRLVWLAILAALGSGLAAAGVVEWLDASVRGPVDASALGLPVLAAIPRIGPAGRRGG